MQAGDSLRSWKRVFEHLSQFVELAGAAGDAIAEGDAPRARALVHETRGIRAALIRANKYAEASPLAPTAEGIELLSRMRALHEQSKLADRIARAWIERELPDDISLERIEGGFMAMADRLLPPTWDVELDIVALIGPGGQRLARALETFGQKRIVVYAPSDEGKSTGDDDYPDSAMVITERAQLSRFLAFSERLPERLVCHRSGHGLEAEDYASMCRDVEESFGALMLGHNTVSEFGNLWLEQGMANLPAIAASPSVAHIGDRFAGRPMVIVAPGPSLSKNVHLLAELQGKAIIATFSHTLSALRAAGIRPNIVLAVDMEDLRYHFDEFDLEDIDVLALGLTVHPDLYSLRPDRTMAFASNSHLDDWLCAPLDEDMKVPSGGSVAHSAFSLGVKWGCNPIVLVGQDLSFPDGKVYCDSNVDGSTTATVSSDGTSLVLGGWSDGYAKLESIGGKHEGATEAAIKVPGWAGGEVVTSATFALFRRWFIDAAEQSKDVELFNCTEGGAHIDGWRHVPLRELIDRHIAATPGFDVATLVSEASDFDVEKRQERVLDRLSQMRRSLRSSKIAATKCKRFAASALRGKAADAEKLRIAERRLVEALRPISFLALAAQKEIQRGTTAARDEDKLAGNLRASSRLFDAILGALESFEPRLKRCIDELTEATS